MGIEAKTVDASRIERQGYSAYDQDRRQQPYLKMVAAVVAPVVLGWLVTGYSPLRGVVQGIDWVGRMRESAVVVVERVSQGAPIKIYRDPATGMVTVDAETEEDMVFGQGFAVAKDRLFQLEIFRRVAKGQLSELIGEKGLHIDKWHKTMGFGALVDEDWRNLQTVDPTMARMLTAYTEGINSYLKDRSLWFNMPADLMLLGCHPKPFTCLDILAFMRWHASAMNKGWQNELLYTKLYAGLDSSVVDALREMVNYDSHGKDALGGGMTATLPKGNELGKGLGDWATTSPVDIDVTGVSDNGGSNAWAISGRHTKSGKPIVANDPHLPFSLPCVWHNLRIVARKASPPIDAVGFSIPMMPYMISGHTTHIAAGVTLGRCDVDDVFLEKTRVVSGVKEYLDSDGEWKPVTRRVEYINVKGKEKPEMLEVEETRRGPLVCKLLGIKGECSLASLSAQKPGVYKDDFGGAGISGLRDLVLAKNYDEFRKATSMIAIAQLNMVYGDVEGNIGYQMSGRVPNRTDIGDQAREGWNKDHQWNGWHSFESMPHALNPEQGYIISANQKPYLDGSDPEGLYLGSIWQHGWRAKRIEERFQEFIANGTKMTAEDSRAIQRDLVAIPARRFAEVVAKHLDELVSHDGIADAANAVAQWDGSMTKDSAAAAIYATVKEAVLRKVLKNAVPDSAAEGTAKDLLVDEILGVGQLAAGKMTNDLEGRQAAFFLRVIEGYKTAAPLLHGLDPSPASILVSGFKEAVARLEGVTGSKDVSHWRWGALHTSSFVHPLGKGGFPLNHMFNVEANEVPGDIDTVCVGAYLHQSVDVKGLPLPNPIYQQRGFAASTRHIVDFNNMSTIMIAIAPGNSGRPSSPHYSDHNDILTSSNSNGAKTFNFHTPPEDLEVVIKGKASARDF